MPIELIEKLKQQHKQITVEMREVEEEASKEKPNYPSLLAKLNNFRDILLEHLELEDAYLYPELKKRMEACNEDPTEILAFIEKIVSTSKDLRAFLDKYSSAEAIEANISTFRIDLISMMTTVFMRISGEKIFVHGEWNRCELEQQKS